MLSLASNTVRTIAGTASKIFDEPVAGPALSSSLRHLQGGVLDPFDAGGGGGGPADALLCVSSGIGLVLRLNRRMGMISRIGLFSSNSKRKASVHLEYAHVVSTPCGWLLMCASTFVDAVDPRDGRVVRVTEVGAVSEAAFGSAHTKTDECVDSPLDSEFFGRIAGIALDADASPPRAIVVRTRTAHCSFAPQLTDSDWCVTGRRTPNSIAFARSNCRRRCSDRSEV